jgi:lipoprotein-anchoring transpeptidase ErfK/SrfK
VYLPNRPNQSQGWIRIAAVTESSDEYLVRVQLGEHHLTVYKDARVILTTPVGVGQSVLPTPTGTYYVVELLKQPDPEGAYGPFAFGLSAYSDVLQSFGGGPGQIGIHGTDDPAAIGSNVSHGCVRVPNAVITELAAMLPLGTPVIIAH